MNIAFFWKLGKFLYEKGPNCTNIYLRCSNYLSYYYGNSYRYNLFNISNISKFYTYFPIYLDSMSKISWNSYLELLKLDLKECYFYYYIIHFCGDDCIELKKLIQMNLYSRI